MGAQTSIFWLLVKAVWYMRDWMRLSDLYPGIGVRGVMQLSHKKFDLHPWEQKHKTAGYYCHIPATISTLLHTTSESWHTHHREHPPTHP